MEGEIERRKWMEKQREVNGGRDRRKERDGEIKRRKGTER